MRPARILGAVALAGPALLVSLASPLRAAKPDIQARLLVPESAAAGSRVPIVVEMSVGSGWHVNSHTPAEKFLIPTDVALTATAGSLAPVRYPPHVERRFEFADMPMLVYEGTVRFETELTLPAEVGNRVSIAGSVSFQACNEKQCFPPSRIALEATLVVTAPPRSADVGAESPGDDGLTSPEVDRRRMGSFAAKLNASETRDGARRDTLRRGVAFASVGRRRISRCEESIGA